MIFDEKKSSSWWENLDRKYFSNWEGIYYPRELMSRYKFEFSRKIYLLISFECERDHFRVPRDQGL